MKITYVVDCLDGINGGTERQLYILIRGMVSRGHEVELYVFRETTFTNHLSDFPCPIHCLEVNSIASMTGLRNLWRFRQKLMNQKVDVIHGFFNDVALVLPLLQVGTGIKAYTSRRDMGIWYSKTKLFFLRLFRFTKTNLICNSLAVARLAQELERKCEDSIKVIYNGIDPLATSSACRSMEWAPERERAYEIINVILVANLRPIKRIEDLIMAASRLRNGRTRLKFYVVGDLGEENYFWSLQMLLRCQQLKEDFHFVGPISDPRSGLNRFDIGVLTSASEGFSNSIMEYLNAGLPVVASKVGGNPELVFHGYNGFLYEVGNIDELTEFLSRLACDNGLRQALAVNAKKSMQKFDYRTMIERHEKVYIAE